MKTIPFINLQQQQTHIRANLLKRFEEILDHGKYIGGPEITKLEQELCKYTDAKHCIAVSSGTDALMAALMAYDLQPGDEVITTAFTFMATAQVVSLLKGIPVFVDICPKTFNIDPSKIEAAITSKTKAVIAVGLFGQCPDLDILMDICKKHNLILIEDAAQSFGGVYKNIKSCSLAHVSCTSFFPAKPLGGYGDGGACFTNDSMIADKIRKIINHGQDGAYHHIYFGMNGRLDSIQAAIVLEKLAIFSNEVKARQEVANRYSTALKDILEVPYIKEGNLSVYAQYTLKSNNRDKIRSFLQEKNIPTAVYYPRPLYDQPVYKNLPYKPNCPNTDLVSTQVFSLPMCPYLSIENQTFIIESVKEACK